MTKWIESWRGDLTLRATGGALLLSSWYEARVLRHLVHLHATTQANLGQLALAALMFFSASLGLALTILGRHLGDRITVSERWARQFPTQVKRPVASFTSVPDEERR
jgi:hypothetical protein